MNLPDDLLRENRALRERLALLSQASLSINESLDFDTVLQGVLDSARSLAGARYGVIALHDAAGNAERPSQGVELGTAWSVSSRIRSSRTGWGKTTGTGAGRRSDPWSLQGPISRRLSCSAWP